MYCIVSFILNMRTLSLLALAALACASLSPADTSSSAVASSFADIKAKTKHRYLQGGHEGGEGGPEGDEGGHENGGDNGQENNEGDGHEEGGDNGHENNEGDGHDNEGPEDGPDNNEGDEHDNEGPDEGNHNCPPDRPCNPTLAPTVFPTPPPSPIEANPSWKPPTASPTVSPPTAPTGLFSNANYQQDAEIGLALGVALVVVGGVFGLFYAISRAFRGDRDKDTGIGMTHFGTKRSMFDSSAHSSDGGAAVDSYNNRVPFGTAIDVSMRDSQRGYGSEYGGSQHGYRGGQESGYYEEEGGPPRDYGRGQVPKSKTKRRVERSTLDF